MKRSEFIQTLIVAPVLGFFVGKFVKEEKEVYWYNTPDIVQLNEKLIEERMDHSKDAQSYLTGETWKAEVLFNK